MMEINAANDGVINANEVESKENQEPKYRDGLKFMVISGITAVAAACITTAISKRQARQHLAIHGHELKETPISGTMLGIKALLYATVLTLGAFSIPIYGFCKYHDIKNMEDLRTTMRRLRKTSPPNPDERTEFESVSDFLNYLNERYGKPQNKKS